MTERDRQLCHTSDNELIKVDLSTKICVFVPLVSLIKTNLINHLNYKNDYLFLKMAIISRIFFYS